MIFSPNCKFIGCTLKQNALPQP
uniref:Uncharacterized protein n=1 Tax=Rhizophora mucronata TaxID=61149 RepID=A0A2P2PYG6_RHIMU